MRGRYFRYLFENQNGGLFHSGSIYDKERQRTTNYIYMVGSYSRNTRFRKSVKMYTDEDTIPETIDILVVGGYAAGYMKKLLYIVKNHKIKTVVLPYLAPIQRLVLVEEIKDEIETVKESIRFLQDPYLFLKEQGIRDIYFLYGNGSVIRREPEELKEGYYFEPADAASLQLIREMEGCVIPVVRAGYIVKNGWLFYFGVYGLDIRVLSGFTRDYFSHIENINEISDNANEDYMRQMKRFMQEYQRRFGDSPATTIVMFEGPLYAFSCDNESFLTEKEFTRKDRCEAWIKYQQDCRCTCTIRCMHEKDHDIMQHHKREEFEESRFGILMLGNANLNCYFTEIMARFGKVRNRIRGIGVPNCGSSKDWNRQMLRFSAPEDRIYWICGKYDITSPEVVSDIVLSSSGNRFLTVDSSRGCCIAGYLVPKEDMD